MKKSKWGIVVVILALAIIGCMRVYTKPESIEESQVYLNKGNNVKEAQNKENKIEDKQSLGDKNEVFDRVGQILSEMSLQEKVGQMLLARCPDGSVEQAIKDYHLGGLVLFKRDFEGLTKEEVQNNLLSYKEASELPLTIAVDEEGGSVVRISSNPNLAEQKFMSPQQLDKQGGMERVEEDAIQKAKLLKELGITMNLAPVADISQDASDYIYTRTLGKDAEATADYVKTVVSATKRQEIGSTLKHFPGYGGNVDTHIGVAVDKRPLAHFQEVEWLPFQVGIDEGVEAIMVSHNIVEAIDANYPASLSPKMHEILREVLGFEGIIMTDDLEMDAIKQFTDATSSVVQAVQAGNDMLIVTDYATAFTEIIEAVEEGILEEEEIEESVIRILEWKIGEEGCLR